MKRIDYRTVTTAPSDLLEKQAERKRIARDIAAFRRRGGRIQVLKPEASGESKVYGFNNSDASRHAASASRGGAASRRA